MPLIPPRFHSLRVKEKRQETGDAISLVFDVPDALAPHYRFAPGQYLTLRTTIDGEEVRRSYSICAGPDEPLRVAVKRLEDGRFSAWAVASLAEGDMLDVMTPTGRFGIDLAPEQARTHVAFCAGSGITPVLSILRAVLARETRSRFFLFYGNRSTAGIMFRGEIEALKDRHLDRLSVFHVLSQEEQDVPVLNGRLDAAKARLLLTRLVPASGVDDVLLCGPTGMIEVLEPVLAELGIPPGRIHVERFVSAAGGTPRPRGMPPPDAPPHAIAAITVDGKRREVPVAADEAVLDAALRAGLDLPFACKGGMCSTCRARLVEGKVEMALNYSLEPWELEAGYVLTCQARPTTPHVVVDYDQV